MPDYRSAFWLLALLSLVGWPVYYLWCDFGDSTPRLISEDGRIAQARGRDPAYKTSSTWSCPKETVVVEVEKKIEEADCPSLQSLLPEYLRQDDADRAIFHATWPPNEVDYSLHVKDPVQDRFTDAEKQRTKSLRSLYAMDGDRTWLDHIMKLNDEDIWPLTKRAQKLIYEHQNPKDCSKKRFFKSQAPLGQGLGSAIHLLAEEIAYAMFYDRILTSDDENKPLMDFFDPGCKDCVFEPLTRCHSYANEENTDVHISGFVFPAGPPFTKPHPIFIPILVQEMKLRFPDITDNALKVWTRSQTTAYVTRLTSSALSEIRQIRLNKKLHSAYTVVDDKQVYKEVSFPLHPQTWSIHIRHGDKFKEMRLVPTDAYIKAAEQYTRTNPIGMQKWALVTTEDPAVFDELKHITHLLDPITSSSWKWTFYTSSIERHNTGPLEQLEAIGGNKTTTTIKWISELMMSLECDGFVGTRSSNWNRMIDELRGIWVPGARGPFLEVSRDWDWEHYWW